MNKLNNIYGEGFDHPSLFPHGEGEENGNE